MSGAPTLTQEIPRPAASPSQAHVESRLLYAKLSVLAPGELVTYADLSAEIRKDVQHDSWHHLNTARKWLEQGSRIVTEAVPGYGIRRLTNDEHIAAMQMHRRRAQGHVDRGLGKGACADYMQLASEQQRAFNREIAHLGLLKATASDNAGRALDAAQPASGVRLSSSEAMRALLAATPE